MTKFIIIITVAFIVSPVFGHTVDVPQKIYGEKQIVHLKNYKNLLFYVLSDGIVNSIDLLSGEKDYVMKIDSISPEGYYFFADGYPSLVSVDKNKQTVKKWCLLAKECVKVLYIEDELGVAPQNISSDLHYLLYENIKCTCLYDLKEDKINSKVLSLRDIIDTDILASQDSSSYASFHEDSIVIRNFKGEILWKWKLQSDEYFDYPAVQPPNRYKIIFLTCRNSKTKFLVLDTYEQRIVWEKEGEYSDILAVSKGVKHQAFWVNGKLILTQLPDNGSVVVNGIARESECIFTEDNVFLLCLPSLNGSLDEKKNTLYFKRSSNVLKIIEIKTGELVKEFNL